MGGNTRTRIEIFGNIQTFRVILSVVEESSVAKNAPDGWMFRQTQHDKYGEIQILLVILRESKNLVETKRHYIYVI